jgi:outer membrane receptor protein involved in Fe transport
MEKIFRKEGIMKKNHVLAALCAFGILFCLSVSSVHSQRLTGTFRGTVKDEAGEVLPGVTVEMESPALIGGKRSAVTTESGTFIFGALPPGRYSATFSLPNFQHQKRENIVISVGTTTTEDIILKSTPLEESVTVVGKSPVVDVTKSGTTTTYDQNLLQNLPKTRFTYIDIMYWAPGVSANETGGEEWHSSYGSNYWSDNYLVDGVDTSFDYNGTTWVWNNPDIYQEGEVLAIGTPAEYGDFQGAVVNVVTKSGGNDFHGGLNAYVIPSSFVSNNVKGVGFPPDVTQFPFSIEKSTDFSLEFSGPIKRDKIWFYSNFQSKRYSYSQLGTDPQYPTKSAYDRGFVKATMQLNKNNRLVFSYQHEISDLPDVITPYSPYDATAKEPGWYLVPNLMLTSILGPNTILDLKIGGWYAHDEWVPMDGNLDESGHYDGATGIWSNGISAWDIAHGTKFQANASLSQFADNFIKGNHEFKAGVQYTKGGYGGVYSYSGGVFYYDYGGYPYAAYFQNPYNYGATVNKLGVFVDDAWTITDRLTLDLGLRFDHQDGDIWDVDEIDVQRNPTGNKIKGINNVIAWNNWSPRIGLVYQLTSDKKTIFRANYGHYYEGLALRWFFRLAPSAQTIYAFEFDPETSEYDIPMWTWIPTEGLAVDKNLKNSLCQQFSVGFTRELFADFSLELTYLYKTTKNFLSWSNANGQFEQVDYIDEYTGQTIKVWNQTNDPSENLLVLMNRPEFKQRYKGLIISVQKRMSHNWQLSSSFVISKAYGVSNSSQLTQGSFSGLQDPNDLINNTGWKGLLQSDRTYMFKIQGSYFFPHDFSISFSYWAQTGKPIARTIPVVGMNQGAFSILAEPRGSKWRLDPWYNLDLRLEKRVRLPGRFSINIMADAFNVFNSHTMIDTLTTIGTAEGFMKPARIVPPRRLQLALQFLF